ncbi:hypothetical protein ACH5AL_02645 [Actinacidiphila glaucinigra]|uniref:hypothetical protein n=1 Tax=Actinacidiphila glaucinigra TaxID=235986 RepID=UPI0037A050F6
MPALYREGEKIASLDSLGRLETAVPYEKATYTLTSSGTRKVGWSSLGSRASATWTFASARPAGPEPAELALMNVRLGGPVGASGTVTGGRPYLFTVTAERGGAAATRKPGVQVSFDDGRSWKTLGVRRAGDHGFVKLTPPPAGGYASIRLTGADTSDNTVDQTVIRSFRVARGRQGSRIRRRAPGTRRRGHVPGVASPATRAVPRLHQVSACTAPGWELASKEVTYFDYFGRFHPRLQECAACRTASSTSS